MEKTKLVNAQLPFMNNPFYGTQLKTLRLVRIYYKYHNRKRIFHCFFSRSQFIHDVRNFIDYNLYIGHPDYNEMAAKLKRNLAVIRIDTID